MFCPKCRCEYVDWIRKCPDCKIALIEELPPNPDSLDKAISYEELVNLVKENDGKLNIDLLTTDIVRAKKWSFPYQGYGFA